MKNNTTSICRRCGQTIVGKSVACQNCKSILCEECAKELSVEEGNYYCPGCHDLAQQTAPQAHSA